MLDSLLARYNAYSAWCAPEKAYLHISRSCFAAGDTLWFKGWVQEASRLSALPPSNFLYAELLDGQGENITRVKIKRSPDGFPGYLEIPETLETGDYTLRAYTLWQLNGPEEYLFNDHIRIVGGSGEKPRKTKASSGEVSISFWPQGGRYFAGYKTVMGFKVVDTRGRSVHFEGTLVEEGSGAVINVSTLHDGMGAFTFVPQAGRRYSIQDASGKLHPLPEPSSDGATLQLHITDGQYSIGALGYGGGQASLLVRDASQLRPLAQVQLDSCVNTLLADASFFNPGINHLLLVSSRGKILSERLFFVRDTLAPVCTLKMERFPDRRRALVSGVVSLSAPDGSPLDGNCSVSVVRGALRHWQQQDGMVSYMGLSSELKGRINNPYYYFDPAVPQRERDEALDLLMLIQGWRYYPLDEMTKLPTGKIELRHMRELVQEVRVTVSRRVSKKIPKDFTFSFMIPRQNVAQSFDIEKGRSIIVDSLDFRENTEMLINIGTSRLGTPYLPKWSGDIVAPPFVYAPAPGYSSDVWTAAPVLKDSSQFETLQAAVVTASYPDDDVLVFGTSFREDLEVFSDMTLVEYLSMKKGVFEYDGEHMYNRSRRRAGSRASEEESSSFDDDDDDESGRVKLIVGDTEDVWWGYDMLRLEDIRSLSISMRPDPVFGGDGGVVHISLKPGGVHRRVHRNPSLLYFMPLGYQVPRYFQAPRYDQGYEGPYDTRNTLWWSPNVAIREGIGSIAFCNSDLLDFPYVIRIEGLSADGRPFSHHCLVEPE